MKLKYKSNPIIIPPLGRLDLLPRMIDFREEFSDIEPGSLILTPHTPPDNEDPIELLNARIAERVDSDKCTKVKDCSSGT